MESLFRAKSKKIKAFKYYLTRFFSASKNNCNDKTFLLATILADLRVHHQKCLLKIVLKEFEFKDFPFKIKISILRSEPYVRLAFLLLDFFSNFFPALFSSPQDGFQNNFWNSSWMGRRGRKCKSDCVTFSGIHPGKV